MLFAIFIYAFIFCYYHWFICYNNLEINIRLLRRLDLPEMKFTVYFLGYEVKLFTYNLLETNLWLIIHKMLTYLLRAECRISPSWSDSTNCVDLRSESYTWAYTVRNISASNPLTFRLLEKSACCLLAFFVGYCFLMHAYIKMHHLYC